MNITPSRERRRVRINSPVTDIKGRISQFVRVCERRGPGLAGPACVRPWDAIRDRPSTGASVPDRGL